ncbi:protein of unknown function [Georgfuchsia toluolica]|uniref:Uncharacterized protein n=1 Tax=Georgfuchsia toluolica TaxID=424218 RepID=A0A916J8H6_9PROT|nr:protein of unknown function [Georgfuchsia toluolica]
MQTFFIKHGFATFHLILFVYSKDKNVRLRTTTAQEPLTVFFMADCLTHSASTIAHNAQLAFKRKTFLC